MVGERRDRDRVLVGRPERKRQRGKPMSRWEGNIIVGIQELEYGGVNWIDLAQDKDRWRAVVNMVMNLLVP
jgi:hypothetical protein